MHQPITFAVMFSYVILFVTKGIPIIIGLISLFRLLPISGIDETKLSRCVPNLIIIMACISMISMSWLSTLSLALVCIAIIVMNRLKPE